MLRTNTSKKLSVKTFSHEQKIIVIGVNSLCLRSIIFHNWKEIIETNE